MNEPKGIDIDVLFKNYQAAIYAIREVDTKASVVIEGKNYASSSAWESVSDKLKDLADPQGKIVYEAHAYFDRSSSGTYPGTYDQEISNTEIYRDRIDPFVNCAKRTAKKVCSASSAFPTQATPTAMPATTNLSTKYSPT